MAKQENILPKLPFDSEEFFTVWSEWIQWRKEKRFGDYKPIGMKWAIKDLLEISEGNEQKAILTIEKSMRKGWRGFFSFDTPNTNKNERQQATNDQRKNDLLSNLYNEFTNP